MSRRKLKKLKKKRIGIDRFGHKETKWMLKMVNLNAMGFVIR